MSEHEDPHGILSQPPAWALWLLGFFSLMAIGAAGGVLSWIYQALQDNRERVTRLEMAQAVTTSELMHITGQIKGVDDKLSLVLAELAEVKTRVKR